MHLRYEDIYEATGGATTPLPPSATFTPSTGTFVNYETVIGQTSNAHAVIISHLVEQLYFYYISGTLVNTENVVGQTSGAIAQVSSMYQQVHLVISLVDTSLTMVREMDTTTLQN